MLAYSSLSRCPKGLFVWMDVESVSTLASPFCLIRKASFTQGVAKDL